MRGADVMGDTKTSQSAASSDAEIVRGWLRDVMRQVGLKPTPFAKAVGVAPSTILRALDAETKGSLERSTISKITYSLSVPGPPLPGAPHARPNLMRLRRKIEPFAGGGFSEPDMLLVNTPVPELAAETQNQSVWQLMSRACELAGYLPGDYLLLDQSVPPVPRDLVYAQIYDLEHDGASTVPRIYDPPYLVTETMDPLVRAKPVLVDNAHVKIMGTVIRMVRRRRPT